MQLIITFIGVAFFAMVIAWGSIPFIIKWAHRTGQLTQLNNRTSHKVPTPALGGIGILLGMFVLIPFLDISLPIAATCLSAIILFTTGLIDDLNEINAKIKLVVQTLSALLIYFSGLQIENLHGLFGIFEISELWGFIITILFVVGVTNSFNLMDGINGLAGSLTVVNSAVFALIFYFNGQFNFALIAFAMLGSVLGFLRYNMRNAKIFMGDTGSLFLGLLMSVFVIKAFQSPINTELSISLALVPMFIPIFDTLRLITTRIMEGKSPLKADKNHLHHLVVNATRSHSQATFVIIVFHITLLGFVTFEMYSGGELLLNTLIGLLIFGVMVFLSFFIVVEMYRNLKRFRSHLKLLTGDNSLLKKL